jgi:hypothetical protein
MTTPKCAQPIAEENQSLTDNYHTPAETGERQKPPLRSSCEGPHADKGVKPALPFHSKQKIAWHYSNHVTLVRESSARASQVFAVRRSG